MGRALFSILAAIFLQLTYPTIVIPSGTPNLDQDSSFALPIRIEVGGKLVHGLADDLKPGIRVSMLAKNSLRTCNAMTGSHYTVEDRPNGPFPATLINSTENCPETYRIAYLSKKNGSATIATVGTLEAVNQSQLDAAARNLLHQKESEYPDHLKTSSEPPRTIIAKGSTLLVYSLKGNKKGRGVILHNDTPFILEGTCTEEHTFFTVDSKLFITYAQSGCDSGMYVVYVYDLSTPQPTQVYKNGILSV